MLIDTIYGQTACSLILLGALIWLTRTQLRLRAAKRSKMTLQGYQRRYMLHTLRVQPIHHLSSLGCRWLKRLYSLWQTARLRRSAWDTTAILENGLADSALHRTHQSLAVRPKDRAAQWHTRCSCTRDLPWEQINVFTEQHKCAYTCALLNQQLEYYANKIKFGVCLRKALFAVLFHLTNYRSMHFIEKHVDHFYLGEFASVCRPLETEII